MGTMRMVPMRIIDACLDAEIEVGRRAGDRRTEVGV